MANIKIEASEHASPSFPTHLSSQQSDNADGSIKEWDASMELALLNAVARCKPVGLHKHFRILSVQRELNLHGSGFCSVKEIWDRLADYYGMEALDELEEEDEEEEEEEREEEERRKGEWVHEFSLPLDEYEQLISEHRQDDQSSVHDESPASPIHVPTKRTRTSKRDGSPAVSVGDSAASTPDPDEGKPRRTSRGARKADATPERQTGGRKASKASASSGTRGGRRQSKRK
ncbi:chromatin modification-related protein EAF7-domain-containing protein [Radiomyces spectabilis]|uniref:chromatin modification-related protein EAF7-domain-containing protein n=1 Tax=Radiomyces spectabilis TaxID=64574 RepID=UPI0022208FBE|nr:chromatin modification-related protein EAF7-domain-containing protein [Radiomyces spectabilis]KAI8391560.1 chromatin modification-related protein EAF7-domain-containing protein [Radiomyces spectabilis]